MPHHSFGDHRLRVDLVQDAQRMTLALHDRSSTPAAPAWGPAPLVTLEIHDKMQMRIDRVTAFRIDQVEVTGDSAHVTLVAAQQRVVVGLWLRVHDGELVVRMPMAEVSEHHAALYRLFAVDLLPGLMRSERGGELLLPLNCGAICSPAGKPALSDRFLIYGEQPRWELLPTTPLCAVQTPRGGMMALATTAAADTRCEVATDGQGGGQVGMAFHLREHWIDPVEPETREMRFVPVPAGGDVTVFAAKRLRRHVMHDLGKPTLIQRIKEDANLAYALDAYFMKLFYAIQRQGIMMYGRDDAIDPRYQLAMTFAEAQGELTKLRDAGLDKVYTQSVGWNPRGHDGAWPSRFPIDERLGGEAGFRDLLAHGKSLGFLMTVHDNMMSGYRSSPEFSEETTVQDVYGEPMICGFWGGGINYMQWPLAFGDDRLEGVMRRLQAIGVQGPYYIDGMGNPCYVNYHPRHRGSRSDFARGIDLLLRKGREVFGAVATECGFLYCALNADIMATCGDLWHLKSCKPEWPVTRLIDRRVPLWQLAMHGLIIKESHGENWEQTMRCVLMGDHPRFEFSTRPGVMPLLDDAMLARLRAKYEIALKRFGRLQTLEITNYRAEAKVEETTYEDGTRVTADFEKMELIVDGRRIEKPAAL